MEAIVGGIIIGIAASIMLLFNGRITGISGITGSVLNPVGKDRSWRILFLLGLVSGGLILRIYHPVSFTIISKSTSLDYMIAGFLVGFGTLLGNGCTSGHGVCGISRLSMRSVIATMTFIASGVVSVLLFKFLRGGL